MTSVMEMASAVELLRGMSSRQVSRNDITACVSRVVTRRGNVRDLILVWAMVRDVRGNIGWRDGSHWLYFELYKYFPETMSDLLLQIPEYGRWRDFQNLYELSETEGYTELSHILCNVWVKGLTRDYNELTAFKNGEIDCLQLSNCAKYVPKEGRSLDRRFRVTNKLANIMFPNILVQSEAKSRLRKVISEINSELGTTEKLMNGNWSDILFNLVPSECFKRNLRSFLNVDGKQDMERLICRKNCIEYLKKCREMRRKTRKLTVEGIVRNVRKSKYYISVEEEARLEGIYELEILKYLGLGNNNGFVVADMSGSMSRGDRAIDVAISSAIAVSDISYRAGSVYGGMYMTTGITPLLKTLHDTPFENGKLCLSSAIKKCKLSRSGGSIVDIVKCYDVLLQLALENRADPTEIAQWLLVISDIRYDHTNLYIGRNTYDSLSSIDDYFTDMGVKPMDEVLSHIDDVYRGAGYTFPRLIYYNVRTDVDFTIETSDRLVHMVGYEGDILKRVYSGDFTVDTGDVEFKRKKTSARYHELSCLLDVYSELDL